MFGRMLHEALGKIHFWITFIGVNAIFLPMHTMGIMGHPRRYAQATDFAYLASTLPYHKFITIAAIITATGQLLFLANFVWCLFKGKEASENPWEATTLEWTIPSPPPHDNFAEKAPVVHHGPYEYGVPDAPREFVLQTDPPLEVRLDRGI